MTINIRKALGALIQGFGAGGGVLSTWMRLGPPLAMSPDPAHGFIYPCHPHLAPWYATAFTIVQSWDFIAFFIIAFLGLVIRWEEPQGSRMRPKWTYGRADTLALIAGAALGVAFVVGGERPAINWVMAHGVKPPAVFCAPLFPGGS